MNYCVPSTMHQSLIQWHEDDVELVRVDESVSITTADPVFWELVDFECFSGKLWEGGFIKISNESQQPMQAIGSESLFLVNSHGFTSAIGVRKNKHWS